MELDRHVTWRYGRDDRAVGGDPLHADGVALEQRQTPGIAFLVPVGVVHLVAEPECSLGDLVEVRASVAQPLVDVVHERSPDEEPGGDRRGKDSERDRCGRQDREACAQRHGSRSAGGRSM